MKRFLMVLMVLLVGVSCLSAETVKGHYYDKGIFYEETWYYCPVEDKNGVFTLSEVQAFLELFGGDEYNTLGMIDGYREMIVEMLAYDHVEYQEDNNLLEVKTTGNDTPMLMYVFQIDKDCSKALFFNDSYNTLLIVRKL